MYPIGVKEMVGIVVGDGEVHRKWVGGGTVCRVALGVPEGQLVATVQLPVNLRIPLIVLRKAGAGADEVVVDSERIIRGVVGKWISFGIAEQIERDGIGDRN